MSPSPGSANGMRLFKAEEMLLQQWERLCMTRLHRTNLKRPSYMQLKQWAFHQSAHLQETSWSQGQTRKGNMKLVCILNWYPNASYDVS